MGRKITVIKANLLDNIKDYHEAVTAFKIEAERQLTEQLTSVSEGSLKVSINLVTPINKSEEYDKLIKMFEWDESETVELTDTEFNHYILDEVPFAVQAKFLNSTYRG